MINNNSNLNETIIRMRKNMGLITEACKNCNKRTIDSISNLDAELQKIATEFVDTVKNDLGMSLTITDGFRSYEQQDRLYCQGRQSDPYCRKKGLNIPGKIVTRAKGGESNHNTGMAFDVYFQKQDGSVDLSKEITPEVAQIAKDLGLSWGGDWKNKDYPHFELLK